MLTSLHIPHTIPESAVNVYIGTTRKYTVLQSSKYTAKLPENGFKCVNSLAELAVQSLASSFESIGTTNYENVLQSLKGYYKEYFLEILPLDIPLYISIKYIPDGIYWKRISLSRWTLMNDVHLHNGSWKQLFIEKIISELIESASGQDEVDELLNMVRLSEDLVKVLRVSELKSLTFKSEEPSVYRCLNFYPVFSQLKNLRELHIVFGVRSCGMLFEPSFFYFSQDDCFTFGQGLAECPRLSLLRIHRSFLDAPKLDEILKQIGNLKELRTLSVAHCNLGNDAVQVIVKFLQSVNLNHVDLTNNKMGHEAMDHLSQVPEHNELKTLGLSLNPLEDEGGLKLTSSLHKFPKLESLLLDGCSLGSKTATDFAKFLSKSNNLTYIDLSNNVLGPDCGELIIQQIKSNIVIKELDLRMTGISNRHINLVQKHVKKNRESKIRYEAI